MKNQAIKLKGGNGNGNGQNNALSGIKETALDFLVPKKNAQTGWTVEIPFIFFFKKHLKIKAESIMLTDSGDLLIIEDSDKAHYTGFSRGQWCRFYLDR